MIVVGESFLVANVTINNIVHEFTCYDMNNKLKLVEVRPSNNHMGGRRRRRRTRRMRTRRMRTRRMRTRRMRTRRMRTRRRY